MDFRVLGTISAVDGEGVAVDLGGPQQRLVLALLLSHAGYVVSTDRFIHDIWGDEPPSSARKTVQGYVSGLRKAMDTPDLVRSGLGYRLDVDPSVIDAVRFEHQVAAGRNLITVDAERARDVLADALDLWRGSPYEDLDDVPALRPEITRLEELRLGALQERIYCDVLCGRSVAVVPELEQLVQADPLREGMAVLLALALYRANRQTEALRVIDDSRRYLAREIGVEPSPQTRLLEQRILEQSDALNGLKPLSIEPMLSNLAEAGRSRNPYRGLRAFSEQDASDFFGRDALVRKLRFALDRRGSPRLMMLAGPSGSGKSSAARAGLLASLAEEGRQTTAMYPGDTPLKELTRVLSSTGDDTVLLIDQFEEVFSSSLEPSSRDEFLDAVAELATSDVGPTIVGTIRADFLDAILAHASMASLLDDSLILVPPMSDHEIRSAVVEPARNSGVTVEPDLVAEIIRDATREVSALPLLQYALTDLFDRCDGDFLTLASYRAAGGLVGALAGRADEVFESFNDVGKESVRHAFLRMVSLTGEGEPMRKRLLQSDLDDLPQIRAILDAFGSHRLITFAGAVDGPPTVEIAHEALLRDWPLLGSWIATARLELMAHNRLGAVALEWESKGRDADYLLFGSILAQYEDWPSRDVLLSDIEAALLAASREERTARDRVRRRRRGLAFVGLIVALIVVSSLAAVAARGRQEAEQARIIAQQSESRAAETAIRAETRAIVNEALVQIDRDTELALLLAIEAFAANPQESGALLATLNAVPGRSFVITEAEHPSGSVAGSGIDFNSPGQFVAVPSLCAVETAPGTFITASFFSGEAVFIDSASSTVRRLAVPYNCRVFQNPEGDRLIGDSVGQGTQIVSATSGGVLVDIDDRVVRPQWGPDGRIVAFARGFEPDTTDTGAMNSRSEIVWVDPTTGSYERTGVMAVDVDWSPDGAQLLVTDGTRVSPTQLLPETVTKVILDSRSLEVVARIGDVEPASATTAWSRDGRYVGDVSRSGVVRVWETTTGNPILRVPLGGEAIEGAWLAFAPTNNVVAVAARRGEISFLDLRTGAPVGSPVASFVEEIAATSFLPDGRLAVVRDSGIVEVVDLNSSALAETTIGFSTVASRVVEVGSGMILGGFVVIPDRGDFASARRGNAIEVVDFRNQERWTVDGVATESLSRWVLTDGSLVVIDRNMEMVRFNRAGDEIDRGKPVPPGSLSDPDVRLLTIEEDLTLVSVLTQVNQFGFPRELSATVVDMTTFEPAGQSSTVSLPTGTSKFFVGQNSIAAYNFGAATLQTVYLDGTAVGSTIKLDFVIDNVAISADGRWAFATGVDRLAVLDLQEGRIDASVPVGAVGPATLLSDGRVAVVLTDGRLSLWSTNPLRQLGVLASSDPSALTGFVVADPPNYVWFDSGTEFSRITVDPAMWAELACDVAGRSLTAEEWARFVSSERAYDPAC